jgi:type VI secretion system protein ImpG
LNEEFLSRYQQELEFFRDSAESFADQYPKIAGRLRIDSNSIDDPHVSRLVEAFAFLTARIRLKIDDDFPEICEAMLHALYPHYLAPFPPVVMVQLGLEQADSEEKLGGYLVDRGARLETDPVQGTPCRFKTCYATKVYPIQVENVSYSEPPFPVPSLAESNNIEAVLHIKLKCESSKVKLNKLKIDKMRWFVGGGPESAPLLYENIMRDCVAIGIGSGSDWQILDANHCLKQVGFANEDSLLPDSARQLSAYRILSEFFVFSEKFRFCEIEFGKAWAALSDKQNTEIVFYLNRSVDSLVKSVDKRSMQLYCTPAINTFVQRAEPIRLNDLQPEYRVVPDANRTRSMEVISIDRVTATTARGETRRYVPFYASSHEDSAAAADGYWYATRRPAIASGKETDRGSEVFLTLVDLNGNRAAENDWTLDVEATCSNRDFVAKLPIGDKMKIHLVDSQGTIKTNAILPPTSTFRRVEKSGMHWRLISQLSLNHLSLTDPSGSESLREILRLHNPSDSLDTRGVVDSVKRISFSRENAIARVRGATGSGLCRGVDIEIWLEGDKLVGFGSYLFASVLENFLGLFATINSFTRSRVYLEGSKLLLLKGKPKSGHNPLI